MLISLHLPKTAGTSFRALLEAHYGDRLIDDYADRPLHERVAARRTRAVRAGIGLLLHADRLRGVDAVHGHFLAIKYSLWSSGSGWRRVTWLRDPVERLASHYHYWRRSFDADTAGPLHRRMMEEDWSLERFCLGPELRNVYRQFLWGVPLARLDFVGITEYYATDAEDFARRFLGLSELPGLQSSETENANPAATVRYVDDVELRARIERHHAADVALYREALRLRERRLCS
ncbi:MAG: hypothetical protein ABR578_08085 [Chromatocurvus sp.]